MTVIKILPSSLRNGEKNTLNGIHTLLVRASIANDVSFDFILSFYKFLCCNFISYVSRSYLFLYFLIIFPILLTTLIIICWLKSLIKNVVFAHNIDNARSPDDFGWSFYHIYCNIVFGDRCATVKQFFAHSCIILGINSNIISLISKTQDFNFIKDFKPITVANLKFKIISKILVDRLSKLKPLC